MLILIILTFSFFSQISSHHPPTLPLMLVEKSYKGEIFCPLEYQEIFNQLKQLPEVNDLINEITQEGNIYIKTNRFLSKKFEGYWDSGSRTILITRSKYLSKDQMLSTLLFEMHNAKRDKEHCDLAKRAKRGEIKRAAFIEEAEYIEYLNALETSSLINKGIEQGLFSPRARWDIHRNFQDHFRLQKATGHSSWHGRYFDQTTPL